jgi:hypothetical protein
MSDHYPQYTKPIVHYTVYETQYTIVHCPLLTTH